MSDETASLPAVAVDVAIDHAARVNFAFQQNAIPVIRRIEIRNNGAHDLHDVVCRFTPSPEWARVFSERIALIPAGSDFILTDVPVELDLNYLAALSDRVRGELMIEVTASDHPTTSDSNDNDAPATVFSKSLPIDVYAFDEWTGLVSLPEILAAFVTPNVSAVESILGRAAAILGEATGSSALDGYQTKSKKRVYQILDAIFQAVREQGIRYCNPPASFEKSGQRVRFCAQILHSKLATCLDLCLLFSSLLEQAGLRPLILMHEGHAYVGCWLIPESLPEPASDDLQSIRKRTELDEILVFETTLACEGNRSDFDAAVAAAGKHLRQDAIFQEAIDLFRSRASGIRPLPLKRAEEEGMETLDFRAVPPSSDKATPSSTREERVFAEEIDFSGQPAAPEGRIGHWKQQLLDLTLRNRLLNFRETKQTIPLVCPDPEHLEDQLALDQAFQLKEQSKLMAGLDPRSLALQEKQFADDPLMTHLTEELRAKRLRSSLTDTELGRRLLELFRRTRMEMEESGVNTLYLALGFLEWKEARESDKTHLAPILLVPVKLERKSVQQGFALKRYDEDPMINVTLLELLKRDFELEIPGVNPPPDGEQGVDVARVFRAFQQAVKDLPGWEVRRDVWLAQFSFNKFLLWKDLHDRVAMLTRNSVVDHLVNKAGQPFIDGVEGIPEEELDDKVPYDEVFCPVSADSSQLASILAASRGKNLVLHGPPGTGKSQTITNLIAHSLALGKRVLFVAEKRAALEVVHRRLSQIGLAPFCLELHSNKAGKMDVLRQFGDALDFGSQQSPAEWEHLAAKLETARSELNGYVRELHRRYPNGMSAFHGYSWLIARQNGPGLPAELEPLRIDGIESHSREHFENLQQLCDDLQLRGAASRLSDAAKDALKPVRASSWTPDWEDQAVAAAREADDRAAAADEALAGVQETLGGDFVSAPGPVLEAVAGLCRLLTGAPALPAEFVAAGDWQAFRAQLEAWIATGRNRDAAREKLGEFDLEKVLALDLPELERKHSTLASNPGVWSRIRIWFLLKPVRTARRPGTPKWTIDGAPEFFATAEELAHNHRLVTEAREPAVVRLGDHWAGGEADWKRLEQIRDFGDELHDLIGRIAGESVERLIELRTRVGQLLATAPDMLATGKPVAAKFVRFSDTWTALRAAEQTFRERLRIDETVPLPVAGHLPALRELTRRIQSHRADLQNWCRWQQSVQQAEAAQLDPLLRAVDSGLLPLARLREAFEQNYRENFIRRLLTLSETLREFWGDEQEKRIEAFNDLDDRFIRLTAQTVVARLSAELPRARSEECPRNTELGILQRERAKKARHKPVRKLLQEIPSIAPKLKPCFLMSPLSVAQYLDAGQDHFDLVVFDEASQIPVWDAVGAIARGKQLVIVGDPKQLPPTNFFGRVDTDDEAIDDGSIVDLESILDECLGSGLPVYYLRWHYRSRREGLIAFSNRHYYENQLHTFPAPHAEAGVRLEPVPDGFYDKGKSRTNLAEAEAIRSEVVRRLTDPELSRQSIGIVTFSQAQQTLVMDKLDEARRDHPEIEGHFGDDVEEPVFVKNLENVQGDERDVILFSVCYGPDETGRVSMNFGPLNRNGGERRLNVAITRAKHEIVVFSTLRSEQIDLARTRARGVEHLKAYLEYAERGPRALAAAIESAEVDEFDSVFESQVADFLRARGFEVQTQIGCSGYRIDLAVVAPDAPGRYLLGIECDGASYHRASTARDRDRLRQAVLEGLGWRIHRIWSTDWWRDREKAEERLLAAVEEAAENSTAITTDPEGTNEPPPPPTYPESSGQDLEVQETPVEPSESRAVPYPTVTFQAQSPQELFYEPKGSRAIQRQIERIIEAEGPITETLLQRRIRAEWGFNRSGPRIREIIRNLLPPEGLSDGVFWPKAISPDDFRIYRTPTNESVSVRKIEEIPAAEIRNAFLDILERYLSYPRTDLLREVAKCFGISRLTANVTLPLEAALDSLIAQNLLLAENGSVKLR